jgi:RNA polymerase sporulation-specific sigma factor
MKYLGKKTGDIMYNKENDNELIYLVSESNEDAKELIYEKYRPIIEMKAKKYVKFVVSKGYDINDLIQEGMIGLTQAINDFKEQKNVQFQTFANLCIDRKIFSFIRNITRDKHRLLNESISIDASYSSTGKPLIEMLFDENNINPEEIFIERETKYELFNKIDEKLSKSEKEVFDLRMQGFSYKEISELLNITSKAVDGTLSRIKNKITNILEKD